MIYIIGPLNPVALFSIVIITAQLDFKLMRYQWTAASRTLLRTQNLTVLATSSTEATLTKAQGWRVRITAFHVPSISFWKAFLSSDLRMTLPVRIAFNEEKSAILIKPPAETYLRVRARQALQVSAQSPVTTRSENIARRRVRARGRWQRWPHQTLTPDELGKREREREKDFLSFGSLPFPLLKGIGNSRVAVYRKGKKIYISPSWPPE